MKKISGIIIFLFCLVLNSAYSQQTVAPVQPATKTVDVNKDGKPDVTYYSDGKYVNKIEADTNYDGKPDVVVHLKDGKFQSAEADTNYDGKPEKKFDNAAEFNAWVNKNKPDFKDNLDKPDWRFDLLNF